MYNSHEFEDKNYIMIIIIKTIFISQRSIIVMYSNILPYSAQWSQAI